MMASVGDDIYVGFKAHVLQVNLSSSIIRVELLNDGRILDLPLGVVDLQEIEPE